MGVTFRQLHPLFVGEVTSDIALKDLYDEATLQEVRDGMDRFGVLVFHDQAFTDEEQLAFAESEAARLAAVADDEEKKLAELRKKQRDADASVDSLVNDEFALAFSYLLKKERQTLDFEFDFNKYRSANRKLRFDVEVKDTDGDRTLGVGTHERRVIPVGEVSSD